MQKTAYEMRISYWSSDVCSSDLADQPPKRVGANIAYVVGGVPQPVEQWQNGANPHATLSAVSVFDSDCASVHIREKNEVAFRPFGLDVPDELAAACQAVKDALAAEQKQLEKARNPIFEIGRAHV